MKKTKLITPIILACTILMILSTPITTAENNSNTYYVSPTGNNTNNGLSWENSLQTINKSIELANPGDKIIVGGGTYIEKIVVDKENLKITSKNGPKNTIIKPAENTDRTITITKENVTIEKLTLENSIQKHFSSGIYINKTNHCTIKNNLLRKNKHGIYLNKANNNLIENNTVKSNSRDGIIISEGKNNLINQNTALGNDRGIVSISTKNNIIKNNYVENNNNGFYFYGWNNLLTNNNMKNNDYGLFISAGDNHTILKNKMTKNNYGISITDSKSNEIKNNEIKKSPNPGIKIKNSSKNTINKNNIDNCKIGIKINNSQNNTAKNNIFHKGGIQNINSSNNTIENNHINGKPIVYLEEKTNKKITKAGQIILVNCEKISIKNLNLSHSIAGIQIRESEEISIDNVAINSTRYAINLIRSNNNTIRNCDLDNNNSGISLFMSNNNSIRNTAQNNNNVGFIIYGSRNNLIENNSIEKNTSGARIVRSTKNTIRNSTFRKNSTGIFIYGAKNSIANNEILRNENGIYLLENSYNNSAHYNKIVGNSEYGIYAGKRSIISAENNWWGDSSGPSEKGQGTGDAVSDNVDYDSWLSTKPDFSMKIISLSLNKAEVQVNENITAIVKVKNKGSAPGTRTIELKINDKIKDKEVNIFPEENKSVTFKISENEPGKYNLEVGGLTKSFKVTEKRAEKKEELIGNLLIIGGALIMAIAAIIIFLHKTEKL